MTNFLSKKILKILSIIFFTIFINCMISFLPINRFDCTKEKKHTISNETKNILNKIDDKIYFKIYFEGKSFTKKMKDYRSNLERILSSFQYHCPLIEFNFIDINKLDEENKKNLEEDLNDKGVQITSHPNLTNAKIFWGGYMTYGKYNYEKPVILLDKIDLFETLDCSQMQSDITRKDCNINYQLNESIKNAEYTLVNSIKKALKFSEQKNIGLLYSYLDVLDEVSKNSNEKHLVGKNRTDDLKNALQKEGYNVEDCIIDEKMIESAAQKINNQSGELILNPLGEKYHCLIINNPYNSFDEKEKLIIDQFIMNGGKTIWLIDGLQNNQIETNKYTLYNSDFTDSLSLLSNNSVLNMKMFWTTQSSYIKTSNNNNLDSLLLNYGVVINNDVVRDYINCPVEYWDERLYDWDYYPLLEPTEKHPIVNNIQKIRTRYISSIDTIQNKIKKTILLETSENTIVDTDSISLKNGRFRINSNKRNPINYEKYNNGKKITAILLEGKFHSQFNQSNSLLKKISKDNKMIVISDGQLFMNSIKTILINSVPKDLIYPLGFDPYINKKYDNASFAINCVNYLLEKPTISGKFLFEIKNKQIDNYPFNESEIKSKQKKWATLNNIIPISIILFISLVNYMYRRKKHFK